MSLSLMMLAQVLNRHAAPEDHKVIVDGKEKGKCTRASFRIVFSFKGVEFPVDYAYELDGNTTALSSRLGSGDFAVGGRERLLVNGKDVEDDDVLIASDSVGGVPAVHVEFRYKETGGSGRSVKFVAPVTAFH